MNSAISRKWWISMGVTVVLLALLGITGAAMAQNPGRDDAVPSASLSLAPGGGPSETMAFSYQGRLLDAGAPANGSYDFIIELYDNPTVGSPLASCSNVGTGSLLNQPVQNGLFTFYLICGGDNSAVFTAGGRWIQVQARRTGTTIYTTLPRQPISPTPYAFSLYPGAVISGTAWGNGFGSALVNLYNNNVLYSALHVQAASSSAVRAESVNGNPFYGYTENGYGVYGYDGGAEQARGYAGYFSSANGVGVYGYSNGTRTHPNIYSPGVYGRSTNGVGVYGRSDASATSWTSAGVLGWGRGNPGGKFLSYTGNLIEGWEDQNGDGSLLSLRFKVSNSGNVYADGSYNCGLASGCFNAGVGAGMAERIEVSESLSPGDLVEIDPQNPGQFRLSHTAYSTLAAGVVATNPAITLNNNDLTKDDTAERTDTRPLLALVGQVPVKVSAENGPILLGDLLVTSSTPGHAMKAGPNPPIGTIVGKALGTLEEGVGVIQMLVTLQ